MRISDGKPPKARAQPGAASVGPESARQDRATVAARPLCGFPARRSVCRKPAGSTGSGSPGRVVKQCKESFFSGRPVPAVLGPTPASKEGAAHCWRVFNGNGIWGSRGLLAWGGSKRHAASLTAQVSHFTQVTMPNRPPSAPIRRSKSLLEAGKPPFDVFHSVWVYMTHLPHLPLISRPLTVSYTCWYMTHTLLAGCHVSRFGQRA